MKFYSGFSLSNDKVLFSSYLKDTKYTISGFSYGAILAFEEALSTNTRIDTLQLFSPAFFQDKSDKYKRMQNMYFAKDKEAYLQNFRTSIFSPSEIDSSVNFEEGKAEDLEKLLSFTWKPDELKTLQKKGTKIEVYLGSEDKIINAQNAKDFFLPYSTVYMINNVGHTLK